MNNPMKAAMEQHISDRGLEMKTLISSGGLFSNPVYDTRTARSLKDVTKLTEEGFRISEDTGIFLWNAFRNYYEPKEKK
jgi:hypothetical protein